MISLIIYETPELIVTRFIGQVSRDYLPFAAADCILGPVDTLAKPRPPIDRYPWRIVLTRWFLLAVEAAIGTYFIVAFRLELGILYVAYGVVCLFMLLPLVRCVRCYYYGKRCNFGWGVWVARLFPRDDANPQSAFYGYTMLFWPLRAIPLLLGSMLLLMDIIGVFMVSEFLPLLNLRNALFLIYLTALIAHRRFYRAASCGKCHEKLICPVYNSRAVLVHTGRTAGPGD